MPPLWISIHKALASLDVCFCISKDMPEISIHKALASLDGLLVTSPVVFRWISIHKALASLDIKELLPERFSAMISIHKALASLDAKLTAYRLSELISIHKALASLDFVSSKNFLTFPRFQSTRLSRASTQGIRKPTAA